jgi:magnesium transporter
VLNPVPARRVCAYGRGMTEQATERLLALDGVPPSGNLLEQAISHASYQIPVASSDQTAGSVRTSLIGGDFSSVAEVAILRGRELQGLVPMQRLLSAPDGQTMAGLMDDDPPVVEPHADQERAAWRMVEHGESSVAVVDRQGRFVGLISPHRMLAVLLSEHDEDLARIGGYLKSASGARRAVEEGIRDRLWHRLPWLLFGLLGAMLSAVIVGAFEEQLNDVLLLAFFLPGIIYLADAVGTQTETVVIRGFSVGMRVRSAALREIVTGPIIGAMIGAAFFAFALIGWGDADVALAVGLALMAACSIASAVAVLVPWTLQRAGVDPAFGSGPVATVIQDLLSIAAYLAIATPIAT